MKKILSIFLAFTIMFLLSACADNSSQEDTSSNNTGETQTSNVSADNILIAYFSYPLDDGVDTISSASRAAYEDGILGNTNYIAHLNKMKQVVHCLKSNQKMAFIQLTALKHWLNRLETR